MRIALGADHAGFHLKEALKRVLEGWQIACEDFGAYTDARSDYPDFAVRVSRAVAGGHFDRGVLVCGTGSGMAMTANKVRGIRAVAADTIELARLARSHNDANVIALGGRILGAAAAATILRTFLDTPFDGGRHLERLEKVAAIERVERTAGTGA